MTLILRYLLGHLRKHSALPPEIPENVVDDVAVRALCQGRGMEMDSVFSDSEPPLPPPPEPPVEPPASTPVEIKQPPTAEPPASTPVEIKQPPTAEPPASKPVEIKQPPTAEPPASTPVEIKQPPTAEPPASKPVEIKQPPTAEPPASKPVETKQPPTAEPPASKPVEIKHPPKKTEPVKIEPGQKKASHQRPVEAVPPATQNAEREEPEGDAKGFEALEAQAQAMIEERAQTKKVKKEEARAKEILKKAGLSFNADFQKIHKNTEFSGQSKHWKLFLNGIMGKDNIDCPQCQDLVAKFNIDRHMVEEEKQEMEQTPQKAKRVSGSECTDLVPVSNPDEMQSPPKKRERPGRPKKSEEKKDSDFNLLQYIEQKRPNQYRFLESEEAANRLPAHKLAQPKAIEVEMSKRPAQCKLCGVYLHFPILTNNLALPPVIISWVVGFVRTV